MYVQLTAEKVAQKLLNNNPGLEVSNAQQLSEVLMKPKKSSADWDNIIEVSKLHFQGVLRSN